MADKGQRRQGNRGGPKSRRGADAVVVATLAAGGTKREAAAAAGVGERTVYRRMSDPNFRQQVAEARAQLAAEVVTRAAGLAGRAMDTLADLLGDGNAHIRLGAARTILTLAAEHGERAELAARLGALEDVLKGRAA